MTPEQLDALVARLRDKNCCDGPTCHCDEAADAIQSLRAEPAAVRAAALREAADAALDIQGRRMMGCTKGNSEYDIACSDARAAILALIDQPAPEDPR